LSLDVKNEKSDWLELRSKSEQFVLHDFPNYYGEFNDRNLRIQGAQLGLSLMFTDRIHWNLASFIVEIAINFVESDVKED